jgi:hypothetical protein
MANASLVAASRGELDPKEIKGLLAFTLGLTGRDGMHYKSESRCSPVAYFIERASLVFFCGVLIWRKWAMLVAQNKCHDGVDLGEATWSRCCC